MSLRNVLTFDLDFCSPELLADLLAGNFALGDCEYVIYSTRKHSPEKPRIRIVVPLGGLLEPDKFMAVMRIAAHKIDATMIAVDNVSFSDAQFMYWPTHCRHIEPVYYWHRSTFDNFFDPDALLEEFGDDWKSYDKLPRTSRESELRRPEEKMQDPRLKNGVVGAFCRTYDIHQAIAEFLPEVYTRDDGTTDRYTFVGGTTSSGGVVYDDGQAFRSFQGSDPTNGRTVNSYEMVRIHDYGHLDVEITSETKPWDVPSYIAFNKVLLDPNNIYDEVRADYVKNLVTEESNEAAADMLDATDEEREVEATTELDVPPEDRDGAAESDDAKAWMELLDMNEEGQIKSTFANFVLILRHGQVFKGLFANDDFRQCAVVLKPIRSKSLSIKVLGRSPTDPVGRYTDDHKVAIRHILEAPRKRLGWGMRISERDIADAVRAVINERHVHEIRDYLNGLKWDGVKRIDQLWIKACHATNTPYHRDTARLWMTAAAARVFEPGCKFDYCPIVEGPQGIRKSTLFAVLGGRWFGELSAAFDDDTKMVEATNGKWIVEIPELTQFGKGEVEEIKAAISKQSVQVRLAWDKSVKNYARQYVMAGTTNGNDYLKDPTGNRRFWPIMCGPGQVDIDWVRENLDQLWAEATHEYRAVRQATGDVTLDMPLYLQNHKSILEAISLQKSRMMDDGSEALRGVVNVWLETPVSPDMAKPGAEDDGASFADDETDKVRRTMTCNIEIWEKALGNKRSDFSRSAMNPKIIAAIMAGIKTWMKDPTMKRCGVYGPQRVYVKIVTEHDDL